MVQENNAAGALLRRYLDKDHAFRTGTVEVRRRTWVSDSFGFFMGEAFSRAAFRDGVAIFNSEPESGRPYFDALEDPMGGYALGFGCGGGNPTGAGGVGSTTDFVNRMPRALFVPLFGGAVAVAIVLVVRPVVAWVALLATDASRAERLVIAFFGIRGMGTIYYLAHAVTEERFDAAREIWAVAILVVVLSIVVHGVTVTPAMRWLDRRREPARVAGATD